MRRFAGILLLAACAEPIAPPPPAAAVPPPAECELASLVREETRIESEPGIEVFVMRIAAKDRRGAAVFTHGGGSQGSALWDLKTKNYSFMRNLACRGWDAYSLDVRGFGGSTKNDSPARLKNVMPDVDAVVRHALSRSSVAKVDLIAWSWGSDVAAMYAGLHPERVRKLAMFAPVYDRRWPERHKDEDGWYPVKRESFLQYHDPQKEDRAVLEEFVEGMFRFAKDGELLLPNGPYLDLYGEDAPLWDAAKIRAPVLIVRGDQDRASLDVHAQKLFSDLTNAPSKRYVVIGGADHFAFRTYKYRELQSVVVDFLEE
jgi:pimeloyl-ACP methyl ester carboxylesterase